MYYPNAPSTPEHKVRAPQTFSPAWSDSSFSLSAGTSSPQRPASGSTQVAPSAPRINSVPLPGGPITPPRSESQLPTPPTSPETSRITGLGLIQLHPALTYNPQYPQALWNIHGDLSRPPRGSNQPAFSLSQTSLTIHIYIAGTHNKWTLEVRNPNGVTVYDVLAQMAQMLHRPVSNQEYGVYSKDAANSASRSFQARVAVDPTAMQTGLKRLDFLGGRSNFAGLSIARDNTTWNVYFC